MYKDVKKINNFFTKDFNNKKDICQCLFNKLLLLNRRIKINFFIDIYNVLGQHVYSLIDGYHFPGKTYEVIWNSDNQSKLPISSGVYLLKAKSAENILIQQITLNKYYV